MNLRSMAIEGEGGHNAEKEVPVEASGTNLDSIKSRHSCLVEEDVVHCRRIDRENMPSICPNAPRTIICFDRNDPGNPNNWSTMMKLYIVMTAILLVFNSTISSAITSNAMPYIATRFNVSGDAQMYLPVAVYLIGYVFGPLVFSPLSETIDRCLVMTWTFNIFILFTLACVLAPNWPSFLIFRLVCGTCASIPLTVIGGLYADIFHDPKTRGRAMVAFMSGTTLGPLGGPIISGFLSPVGWKWVFWVVLILAGCSWVLLIFIPETFGPVILKKRVQELRKSTGDHTIVAPIDLETRSNKEFIVTTLTQPLSMLFFEPLVYLNCLYVAFLYSFFYMFFEAYQIIFEVGIGAALTAPFILYYDAVFETAQKQGKSWAMREELRRLPMACIGGPFCAISLFWLAWTAREDIHWAVPCMSGLFFGFGYLCIFTALLNYLVDCYEVFAASAMAASCFARSIIGATLPLAAKPLYRSLGVRWATSALGFLSLALVFISFALIHYGPRIRGTSRFCQYLLDQKRIQADRMRDNELPNGVA